MANTTERYVSADEKAWMQQALKDLGYYTGEVDGRWGELSLKAMAIWQRAGGYTPADGIPTWDQMVKLGAAQPIVIPRPPRSSGVGSWVLNLLLSKGFPFFLRMLPKPKVSPLMSAILLALSRINKAWVAAVVAFICSNILLYFFGIDVTADTQALISTVAFTIISGFATWLIPNAPSPEVERLMRLDEAAAKAQDWQAAYKGPPNTSGGPAVVEATNGPAPGR